MARKQNDDWVPSEQELKKFKPIREVDPKMANAFEKGKLKRGRPVKEDKKVTVSLRVKPEVLAAYKAMGKGWQKLANAALENAIKH